MNDRFSMAFKLGHRTSPNLGVHVFGAATVAAGIINLAWGDFDTGHQPIQAFGDHVPGREVFTYITAVWLVLGGAAILWRRSARAGAQALAVVYFIFAVFWLPRLYTAPHVLGFRIPVYIAVLGGVAQQLILVAAAVIVCASVVERNSRWVPDAISIARWAFGLCTVDFGLAHLTVIQPVAAMVPKWLPLGGDFWAALTGTCFVLAGIAIVSGVFDVLAVRLLALMLLVFSALVLAPQIFASPGDHLAWGGNVYNLAAVGATWILVDWIAIRHKQVEAAARQVVGRAVPTSEI
jgi:uncharacterized membrane protein YphA (DoxX/SURF4 family)